MGQRECGRMEMSRLELLRSKCTMRRPCKYSIPRAASSASFTLTALDSALGCLSSACLKLRSKYSVTMAGDRWPCTTPKTATTFGCCSELMSCVSRQNSVTCATHSCRDVTLSCSTNSLGQMVFTATSTGVPRPRHHP
eukprot:1343544-Pyramimonas_sp.AAC.1